MSGKNPTLALPSCGLAILVNCKPYCSLRLRCLMSYVPLSWKTIRVSMPLMLITTIFRLGSMVQTLRSSRFLTSVIMQSPFFAVWKNKKPTQTFQGICLGMLVPAELVFGPARLELYGLFERVPRLGSLLILGLRLSVQPRS